MTTPPPVPTKSEEPTTTTAAAAARMSTTTTAAGSSSAVGGSAAARHPTDTVKNGRHALICCDMQRVTLNCLQDETDGGALLENVGILLDACARRRRRNENDNGEGAIAVVVWLGVRFQPGYADVDPNHKLYGSLRRLHDKLQKTSAAAAAAASPTFFLESSAGTQFAVDDPYRRDKGDRGDNSDGNSNSIVIWRNTHLPPQQQLIEALRERNVASATVVGMKTGHVVQATCQMLCDACIRVRVVEECVRDDDLARHDAVVQHLLPLYADVVPSIAEWMIDNNNNNADSEKLMTLEEYDESVREEAGEGTEAHGRRFADCGRGGHFALWAPHLSKNPKYKFRPYPVQPWYSTAENSLSPLAACSVNKSYQCPLGKRVVEFCDEPQFSRLASMYVKGRECLDEKEKLAQLVPDIMPTTYLIENGTLWMTYAGEDSVDGTTKNQLIPVTDFDNNKGCSCWFLKECDKNGGKAVQVVSSLGECLEAADPKKRYVVQAHVAKPRLTTTLETNGGSGRKCHVKLYSLLYCNRHGTWFLYTYPEAFLCTSPNPWSESDTTAETQITTQRHERLYARQPSALLEPWSDRDYYARCQRRVDEAVRAAVSRNKLRLRYSGGGGGTDGGDIQPQFEVFSTDVLFDGDDTAWLIECNFGPVLFDPVYSPRQALTTPGLREYYRLWQQRGQQNGGSAAAVVVVNDHQMIADTIELVFGDILNNSAAKGDGAKQQQQPNCCGKWDLVGTYPSVETMKEPLLAS